MASGEAVHVLHLGPWIATEVRAAVRSPFVLHALFEAADPQACLARCAGEVRAIVCHSGGLPVDRALLARLPRLELVICLGSGLDAVDLDAARDRGIPILHGAGLNAVDVAELAIAMVLALGRGLLPGDRFVRGGRWLAGPASPRHRVSGKRLGILGMGAIGQQLARLAAAFDMEVSYFSRRRSADLHGRFVPGVVELARDVDYLVSTLPGGAATRHLIGAEVFDALGPHGFLVNVGRGSVVDEDALIAALDAGRIAGAALDVFADEPRVPDGLLRSDRALLQAHGGGKTHEAYAAIVAQTVRRLERHFLADPVERA